MRRNKLEEEEMDEMEIFPEVPEGFPLANNVIGKSRNFMDEFMFNVNGERIFQAMGVNPDKTFMIDGPPGVGKTYALKALNNQMNCDVYGKAAKLAREKIKNLEKGPIGIKLSMMDFDLLCFHYDIGRHGTSYINMGSRIIQKFFDEVEFYAKHGLNTLIVCDEADALFAKREGSRSHAEDHKVLETFMKNIQNAHDTKNMYLVLMSNLPESIDPATLRAGRIDKKYTFKLPTIEERKIAFEHAIHQRNEQAGYCVIRGAKADNLAELSKGYSYADVYQSIEEAVRLKVREIIEGEKKITVPMGYIKQKRLETAVLKHKEQFRTDKHEIGFK